MSAAAYAQQVREATKIVAEGIGIGPRMEPCACGAGKHAHAGPARIGRCEATGCRRYRADRAWLLAYQALDAAALSLGDAMAEADERQRAKHYRAHPRGPGEWSIGASDTQTCPRKIQYRNAPPEGFEPLPEDKRAARMGTVIHAEVTRQLKAIYPWRLFDYAVRIAGLDRESFLDMYDPITGIVDDIKTAGDWRWDVLNDEGPTEDTWEQVMLYALALHEAGFYVTLVRLLYVKRCNGHDEKYERPFDQAMAERARDRLLGYATVLDMGGDLPKTGTGPTNDALCRMCFARADCWNIPRAQALGKSPENLTILGEHPEDAEVAWAIQQKVDLRQARLDAEKAEKEAAALVDGIEPGRYGPDGEWEAWSVNVKGSPVYKASYETVVGYLDMPDGQRPTSAHVVPVMGRGRTDRKVGRTRKATIEQEKKDRAALDKAEQ